MTLEPCSRRGDEVRTGFFACASNRLIHPEPGIASQRMCAICPYRNLPDQESETKDLDASDDPAIRRAIAILRGTACVHRGPLLRTDVCNACGMRGRPFEVHACALHGECMTRRFRNDRPGVRVCLACDDFASADQAAPSE